MVDNLEDTESVAKSIAKALKGVENHIKEDYEFNFRSFFRSFLRKAINLPFGIFGLELRKKTSIPTIPLRNSIKYIQKNYKGSLIGVEIGVQKGVNAEDILKKIEISKLYLIDPWEEVEGDVRQEFMDLAYKSTLKRVKRFGEKVEIIKDFSLNCLSSIPDDLDFVYIDGSHFYKNVKLDIKNYWSKIKKGGILSGHDFNSVEHHRGVIQAVIEFVYENKLRLHVESPDWWIVKV